MITPQQFKQRWESVEDDHLTVFPESALADVRVLPEVRRFLTEAGLPDQAAPVLDFGPPESGTLERVSVVWQQPAAFDRYRIIGSSGAGDPICLDEEAGGQVVQLNHDARFQRVLMASSLFALAECLVELRDVVVGAGGDTELVAPERYATLLARLREIDPATCGEGGYWAQEINCLQPAAKRSWWQFWKR